MERNVDSSTENKDFIHGKHTCTATEHREQRKTQRLQRRGKQNDVHKRFETVQSPDVKQSLCDTRERTTIVPLYVQLLPRKLQPPKSCCCAENHPSESEQEADKGCACDSPFSWITGIWKEWDLEDRDFQRGEKKRIKSLAKLNSQGVHSCPQWKYTGLK